MIKNKRKEKMESTKKDCCSLGKHVQRGCCFFFFLKFLYAFILPDKYISNVLCLGKLIYFLKFLRMFFFGGEGHVAILSGQNVGSG